MTRQKKSRNSGNNGQRHLPASEIRKTRETKEETKKKGSGLKSGTRNSMHQSKDAQAEANKAKKDPRIGSKKPIALIAEPNVVEQMPNVVNAIPKAQLKAVKAETLTPEQELASIEADERLQALLERVEQDEVLMGKDAKYFNSKTARLSELLQLLGLSDTDDEADSTDSADAEEDPLARFERTDWRKTLLGDED